MLHVGVPGGRQGEKTPRFKKYLNPFLDRLHLLHTEPAEPFSAASVGPLRNRLAKGSRIWNGG